MSTNLITIQPVILRVDPLDPDQLRRGGDLGSVPRLPQLGAALRYVVHEAVVAGERVGVAAVHDAAERGRPRLVLVSQSHFSSDSE